MRGPTPEKTSPRLADREAGWESYGGRRSQNRGPHASVIELAPQHRCMYRCPDRGRGSFFFPHPIFTTTGPGKSLESVKSGLHIFLTRRRGPR
jgi:hypothetical protein